MIVMVIASTHHSQPYIPFREIVNKVVPLLSGTSPTCTSLSWLAPTKSTPIGLKEFFTERNIANVSVFDYSIERIPQLMEASDMIVAKSGGLATYRVPVRTLALVLVGKSYSQERANTYTVTKAGAAVTAETAEELVSACSDSAKTPRQLEPCSAEENRCAAQTPRTMPLWLR